METPKVPEPEKEPYHARIIEALFSKIVNQTVKLLVKMLTL